MNALHLPNAEFRSLAARVTGLAADLLAGLDEQRAFPAVRAEPVARAFEAPVPKARALLGLGAENRRLIGADETYRLDPQALRAAIAADRSAGRKPLAVVATSGTVNTGAIDPLSEIAALCREQQLWLHVDGAYGALAALAMPEQFTGLSAADSLSLDPHKW